jgi:hypothetical protein
MRRNLRLVGTEAEVGFPYGGPEREILVGVFFGVVGSGRLDRACTDRSIDDWDSGRSERSMSLPRETRRTWAFPWSFTPDGLSESTRRYGPDTTPIERLSIKSTFLSKHVIGKSFMSRNGADGAH